MPIYIYQYFPMMIQAKSEIQIHRFE